MRSYSSTFACALALVSSVTAQGLSVDVVSDLTGSITSLDSLPTGVVASVDPSVVPSVVDSTTSEDSIPTDVSAIVSSVSSATSGNSLPTGAVSPFPTDILPDFPQLTQLSCSYGSIVISPATNGVEVPIAQAASAPSFSTSSTLDGSHILIMIDPDVDTPQILHFMQPGMISDTSKNSSSVALSSSEPAAAEYIGPAPPTGSGPHRYMLFLFPQPDGFELLDSFDASDRAGFDIASFALEHSLGVPIAGTFFVAENKGGIPTSGGPFGNGTFGNSTQIGGSSNGTFPGGQGNSTNSTLHGGSFLHRNETSGNSTLNGGGRNGNGTTSGTNGTSSSSSGKPSDGSSSASSTGPVPISPSTQAGGASVDENDSTDGSSGLFANFAFAGFVALVTVGVTYMQ